MVMYKQCDSMWYVFLWIASRKCFMAGQTDMLMVGGIGNIFAIACVLVVVE